MAVAMGGYSFVLCQGSFISMPYLCFIVAVRCIWGICGHLSLVQREVANRVGFEGYAKLIVITYKNINKILV
jgi:hypothetical protein